MAVYGGVVRAVYRIEGWDEPTPEDLIQDRNNAGRSAFRGRRDPEMEKRYLHRDVSTYFRAEETGRAYQTPVSYVNLLGGRRRTK